MTTTEEIIVSGEDFIERRIVLCPEQSDIAAMRQRAYGGGYKRGWLQGFVIGAVAIGAALLCIWLVLQ